MRNSKIAKSVDTAGVILRAVAWLVLVVGVVWAVALVWAGFDAVEPWGYGAIFATEDWESIMWGFFTGSVALIWAAAQWAVLTLFGGWAAHLADKIDKRFDGGLAD
jgi:hypothetical protein